MRETQNFVCPFCGYRAKSLEELKKHILEEHTLNRGDIRGIKHGQKD
ncbi:hypothetical protein K1720_06885 [Thermococcus argininiproducens]|uniref:C2H2-type domain-containing protein n=1 Tax=Thermococcus argininiproducens TaxID=2866384 RepID=A0A9E7M8B3_9EURY|nr:hypothetical protein [Thermococcus argininiproducens]USG99264.1 hypothetical protein K1720_06885 [Thermococcus argininiproducens]